METEKNRRLRFSYEDDIVFLREVLSNNPILNQEKWDCVATNLFRVIGKDFQIKTLKQHLQLLLQLWLKKDHITKIKSGEEEPYNEKDVLLQEINSICEESGGAMKRKRAQVSKEKQISEMGREARERFALLHNTESFDVVIDSPVVVQDEVIIASGELSLQEHGYANLDTDEINKPGQTKWQQNVIYQAETPSTSNDIQNAIIKPVRRRINKSRTIRSDSLNYLTEKNEREYKIREKELKLEERKIAIEEKRLQIEDAKLALQEKKDNYEIEERRHKFEWEKNQASSKHSEQLILQNLLEAQQKLIDCLTKRLEEK